MFSSFFFFNATAPTEIYALSLHDALPILFTRSFILKGAVFEICPVIVLPAEDLPVIHNTRLHDYYFMWGWDDDQCAIALGYGSLYNHAYTPNAQYLIDIDNETIEFIALRDIQKGEEITVSYNGDPEDQTKVWFDEA